MSSTFFVVISPKVLARLRAKVLNAHPATLTCEFVPGGRRAGAGIPGPFWCVTCNQSQHLHDVAAAVRALEHEESN